MISSPVQLTQPLWWGGRRRGGGRNRWGNWERARLPSQVHFGKAKINTDVKACLCIPMDLTCPPTLNRLPSKHSQMRPRAVVNITRVALERDFARRGISRIPSRCPGVVKSELHSLAKEQFLPIVFYVHTHCVYTLRWAQGGPCAPMLSSLISLTLLSFHHCWPVEGRSGCILPVVFELR